MVIVTATAESTPSTVSKYSTGNHSEVGVHVGSSVYNMIEMGGPVSTLIAHKGY